MKVAGRQGGRGRGDRGRKGERREMPGKESVQHPQGTR